MLIASMKKARVEEIMDDEQKLLLYYYAPYINTDFLFHVQPNAVLVDQSALQMPALPKC